MALAALTAYQAVLLTPILAVYVWLFHRRDRARWLTLLVPPLTVGAWQLFERLSTGALPAAVLSGYLATLQTFDAKLASALALTIHSWFIVFPALVPAAFILAWRRRREPDTLFLLAWIGIFFAGALVIFFAGAARYLLPMAAPVALLASRLRPKWLAAGFALQLALSLGLAAVNYQHWDGLPPVCRIAARPRGGPSRLDRRRMGPALLSRIRRRLAAEEDPAPAPRRHRGLERAGRFRQPRRPIRSAPHGGDPARRSAAAHRPGIALGVLHGSEGFLAIRDFRRADRPRARRRSRRDGIPRSHTCP